MAERAAETKNELVESPLIREFKKLTSEEISTVYGIVFKDESYSARRYNIVSVLNATEIGEEASCASLVTISQGDSIQNTIFIEPIFGELQTRQKAAVLLHFCVLTPEKHPTVDLTHLVNDNTYLSKYDRDEIVQFVDLLYNRIGNRMLQIIKGDFK